MLIYNLEEEHRDMQRVNKFEGLDALVDLTETSLVLLNKLEING